MTKNANSIESNRNQQKPSVHNLVSQLKQGPQKYNRTRNQIKICNNYITDQVDIQNIVKDTKNTLSNKLNNNLKDQQLRNVADKINCEYEQSLALESCTKETFEGSTADDEENMLNKMSNENIYNDLENNSKVIQKDENVVTIIDDNSEMQDCTRANQACEVPCSEKRDDPQCCRDYANNILMFSLRNEVNFFLIF